MAKLNLVGDLAFKQGSAYLKRMVWQNFQDIDLYDDHWMAELHFRETKDGDLLTLSDDKKAFMHSRNLKERAGFDDFGTLKIDQNNRISLLLSGEDTRKMPKGRGYYDLLIIPSDDETVSNASLGGAVNIDADYGVGIARLTNITTGALAKFTPGDEVYFASAEDDENNLRRTILSYGASGGGTDTLVLTDTLETDNASDGAITITRMQANYGMAIRLLEGRFEVTADVTRPSIEIIAPTSSDDDYSIGGSASIPIKWVCTRHLPDDIDLVDIHYRKGATGTWTSVVAATANDGYYATDAGTIGGGGADTYYIRVRLTNDPSIVTDTSDGFTLVA